MCLEMSALTLAAVAKNDGRNRARPAATPMNAWRSLVAYAAVKPPASPVARATTNAVARMTNVRRLNNPPPWTGAGTFGDGAVGVGAVAVTVPVVADPFFVSLVSTAYPLGFVVVPASNSMGARK